MAASVKYCCNGWIEELKSKFLEAPENKDQILMNSIKEINITENDMLLVLMNLQWDPTLKQKKQSI